MEMPIWMQDTSWRESGRRVKIGPLDGRLMIFVIVFVLLPSMYMFYLMLFSFGVFYGLEYIGYTLPNAIRKVKILISGKTKSGIHFWRKHYFKN